MVSVQARIRWTPIPPGLRSIGETDMSGSGTDVGSNSGAGVLQSDHEPAVFEPCADLEPAGRPVVAVDDRVGGRLVDGLDEVLEAFGGRAGVRGSRADEASDLGAATPTLAVDADQTGPVGTIADAVVSRPAYDNRAKSAGVRFTNLPAPFRPVNSPSRTMTEPRERTMSDRPGPSGPRSTSSRRPCGGVSALIVRGRVRVVDHDVGIRADRDRALLRVHPEQLRRRRRDDLDPALLR